MCTHTHTHTHGRVNVPRAPHRNASWKSRAPSSLCGPRSLPVRPAAKQGAMSSCRHAQGPSAFKLKSRSHLDDFPQMAEQRVPRKPARCHLARATSPGRPGSGTLLRGWQRRRRRRVHRWSEAPTAQAYVLSRALGTPNVPGVSRARPMAASDVPSSLGRILAPENHITRIHELHSTRAPNSFTIVLLRAPPKHLFKSWVYVPYMCSPQLWAPGAAQDRGCELVGLGPAFLSFLFSSCWGVLVLL